MDPTSKAKLLRRTQTEAEKSLWFRLRDRRLEGYKFRCQVAIGPYIADFVCMSARLIIEIDGGQHADQAAHDRKRERYLRNEGYEIVRYWNNEVLGNLEGVLTTLTLTLSLRERERRSSRLPEEDGAPESEWLRSQFSLSLRERAGVRVAFLRETTAMDGGRYDSRDGGGRATQEQLPRATPGAVAEGRGEENKAPSPSGRGLG